LRLLFRALPAGIVQDDALALGVQLHQAGPRLERRQLALGKIAVVRARSLLFGGLVLLRLGFLFVRQPLAKVRVLV
jgi:hypothetical protein